MRVRTLSIVAGLIVSSCGTNASRPDAGSVEVCTDGVDNDGDNKTDCADPDCFSAAACCMDLCSAGSAICDTMGIRACEPGGGSTCLDFSTPASCGSGLVCSGGACVTHCVDQCAVGDQGCASSGVAIDCQLLATGCTDWVVKGVCAAGEICSAGTCSAAACSDVCTDGTTRCTSAGKLQACQRLASGCTDWLLPSSCGAGLTCAPPSSACSAPPDAGQDAGLDDGGTDAGVDAGTSDAGGATDDGGTTDAGTPVWAPMAGPTSPQYTHFIKVWGRGPNDVWLISRIASTPNNSWTIHHWNGVTWTLTYTSSLYLSDLWGSGPSDVWAVGSGLYHWDGTAWTTVPAYACTTYPCPYPLTSVWGSNARDVWAAGGQGLALHWDGVAWSSDPSIPDYAPGHQYYPGPMWGTASDDIWMQAYPAMVLHWGGSSWTTTVCPACVNTGTGRMDTGWSASRTDVWVVGGGTLNSVVSGGSWHLTSAGWASVYVPVTSQLNAVWGSGPGDVWAVGFDGYILHSLGGNWGDESPGVNINFNSIWGSGPRDIWAVGDDAHILRYH